DPAALRATLLRFAQGIAALIPEDIAELEINPLVLHEGRLIALDALCTLSPTARPAAPPPRPLHKLDRLLKPQSVAVIGVSDKPTPGHIIVKNLLREGFDPARLYIIKPDRAEMLGCPCVPDVAALPQRVDLFVVTVDAAQTPALIEDLIQHEKAESIIVIPGGLGETAASQPLVARMNQALWASRATPWEGPLINGGNCLGVRSKPGRYDTMFIPSYKLPPTDTHTTPLALISQSGALAVSRASKLAHLNPRYILSIGNQLDLTAGDYLAHLAQDPEVEVFACYVEGFKPDDGRRWLEAARRIIASGREVILYRAGRTAAGQQATASHTASVAGDYAVARALAEAAGVIVAESLSEFEDLTRALTLLRGKPQRGRRVAAISNAGFECVGIADNLSALTLAPFSPETTATLEALFERYRLKGIVEVHNPLDLTPMLGDEGYEAIIQAALADPQIDAAVVGVVPLTPALNSLAPGAGHHEDLRHPSAIAARLGRLFAASSKPWVVVLDGGALYDPLCAALDEAGVPTFRSVDRATRALDRRWRG
ncbi:CoA-binding protein, partial [Myxococcota bacterium]|nr:CoA-binding protein [Myxococcota bacterium]